MKVAHIADLHIGRRFEDLNLISDQKFILDQIITNLQKEAIDVLIIAGDVYDKISPSAEAFDLWNQFLESLASLECHSIIISGNHDSNDRLGVGGRLLRSHRIHLVTDLPSALEPIIIEDHHGPVYFYALPFMKPSDVRNSFEAFDKTSYDEAFAFVISKLNIDDSRRNVLIGHQFFINGSKLPRLSDSEVPNVGGLDAIDVNKVVNFDYCAFGHIHGPQKIANEFIRYAGSPLKYSFSEVNHHKSMPLITLEAKGDQFLSYIDLIPQHDVVIITGLLEDLLDAGRENSSSDYIKAIITNEEDVYDAMGKLRSVYPNIVSLEVRNQSTLENRDLKRADAIIEKSHIERFNDLFQAQNHKSLSAKEVDFLNQLLLEVSENETP